MSVLEDGASECNISITIQHVDLKSITRVWVRLEVKMKNKDNHFSVATVAPDKLLRIGGDLQNRDFIFTLRP